MAQKVIVQLQSDISGEPGDETVGFALDGVSFEIDLTTKEASDLRDALALYVKAGRRVGGRRQSGGSSRGSRGSQSGLDLNEARAWIKANTSHKISDRGRLPAAALQEYKQAHGIA